MDMWDSYCHLLKILYWKERNYFLTDIGGEKLYLEGSLIREAEKVQHSAMELDERRGSVEEYLNMLLPDSWAKMIPIPEGSILPARTIQPAPEELTGERWSLTWRSGQNASGETLRI